MAEGGDATYEVELSGGTSTAEVVVNYEVDANSTATSGTDYTAPGGKLTIAAAGTSGTITIETLTDAVLDPGETVVVKLTSATTDTRTVTVDATATKTTTIQEEDMVSVSVAAVLVEDDDQTPEDESEDRSRVEEGETASFVVTLDGEVSGTVSVPYATANVTAEAGSGKDYTAASGTLEFTAGQTSKTIEVTTLEDGLNEAAETYTLTLTSVSGPAGVKLGTASATGTIEDDDPISAALGTTYTTTVAEGGDATYEVELSGGTSTAEVVVNYEVDANSTATSGTDYTVPGGKLTIAAAGTSGTITIATLTDAVLDPGETLVVKLTSATTDTRAVTVDATATKTTTIQEEDMVSVSVAAVLVEDNDQTPEDESDDRSRVEEGETASFVVTLDGEVSGTVSVPYATANVTAESGAGKDYTAASGTLEFTAGQTSKTIEVTTLEDGLNEAAETYTLTLTSVTGPAGVKLGTASATGTIEDDDALTAALGATYTTTVAEGGDATYEVELSGGTSTAEVVVNYEVDANSTATSGTDYTAPGGKLTIAAAGDERNDHDRDADGRGAGPRRDGGGEADVGDDGHAQHACGDGGRDGDQDDHDPGRGHGVGVGGGGAGGRHDQTPEDESDDRSRVEEGETASFVVTLDGEVSGTVSVPYATANVTAESGSRQGLHGGERHAGVHGGPDQQDDRGDDAGGQSERGGRDLHADADERDRAGRGEAGHGERDGNDRGRRRTDGGAGRDVHDDRGGRRRRDLRGGTERRDEHGRGGGELRGGCEFDGDERNGLHGAWREADDSGGRDERNDHDNDADGRGAGPRRDGGGEADVGDDGHASGNGGRDGDEDDHDPGRGHGVGVGSGGAGGRRRPDTGGRVGRPVEGGGRRDGELRGDAGRRGVGDGERAVCDGQCDGGVGQRQGLHGGDWNAGVHGRPDEQDDRGDDAGGQSERGGRDLHADADERDRAGRSEAGHGERDGNDRG